MESNGPARTNEASPNGPPLVEVDHLTKYFPITTGFLARKVGDVQAVNDVSFTVARGETLGLVGESGSGKTTVGRCILWLEEPTSGEITFDGIRLSEVSAAERRRLRRRMQIIWQDPYGSLNPRKKVSEILGEPLRVHRLVSTRIEERARVEELLERVGLRPAMADRFPHEFSGGQRQRIGIARALTVQPEFIVADEPVSALDVSIQAQLLNLMKDLQDELGLTYLFVAHDLSVVRNVSDRIAVMYLGKLMEVADSTALTSEPLHPYTQALISAVPIPDATIEKKRERIILQGAIPSPADPPSGCVFHTRCSWAIPECSQVVPPLREVSPGRWVACIRV